MRILLLSTVLILLSLSFSIAQQDSVAQEIEIPKIKKRLGVAVAEAMAINVAVWSFDRYLREDNYSFYISWRTVERNLRHGFEWDPNNFSTNFISHPYHGNTYFNAGRTNGLNFWESIPLTAGGSAMWEIFMESEFPSYNDWVMTTMGGVALGESLFRFSELVLDDRARGSGRVGREIAGTLLNPVGGVNRLIRGDMFRRTSTVNHMRNPISGYVAIGGRSRIRGADQEKSKVKPALTLNFFYGEPFELEGKVKPFDYFNFRFWTSKVDTNRNMTVLARAVLVGKNFQTKEKQDHLLGLFQYYDYINTSLFNIGAMTIGGSLLSRFPLGGGFKLFTGPSLGVIVLGAGNNEYVSSYQGRNYNYGWGGKAKLDVMLQHQKFGSILLDYNYWSIHSIEGAPGTDRLHLLNAVYNIRVWRKLGLGVEYTYYYRSAQYDEFPDVKKTIDGIRGMVTLSL